MCRYGALASQLKQSDSVGPSHVAQLAEHGWHRPTVSRKAPSGHASKHAPLLSAGFHCGLHERHCVAAPPEHERCASNEIAGLRRKLRRLTKRVDVLEWRDQGALDD